jgi:hypothetical protein
MLTAIGFIEQQHRQKNSSAERIPTFCVTNIIMRLAVSLRVAEAASLTRYCSP